MRNYKKENEYNKRKYEHFSVCINKNLGIELKQKLKNENRSISNWITENAKDYIERGK